MADYRPTPSQEKLIYAKGPLHVEACPGAGKTKTIVQRFIERPHSHPRKGVALLSFTNAAIDEVRLRCSGAAHLLEVPNFVGTIDGFINRFLVGPTFQARKQRPVRFIDSWASLPNSFVAVGSVGRVHLDWFSIEKTSASLLPSRAPAPQQRILEKLEPDQRRTLENEALKKWLHYVGRGVMDSAASRTALSDYLRDPERRAQLGHLMSNRFAEVIVDEVQDCNDTDLNLLRFLNEFGVDIVTVGDSNQSIYDFRSSAQPVNRDGLGFLISGGRLDNNFRSSPAICQAVNSLRFGNSMDIAVGSNRGVSTPVAIAPYTNLSEVSGISEQVMLQLNLTGKPSVVLAHSGAHARVAAGGSAEPSPTTNRLVVLARAFYNVANSATNGHMQARSFATIERIMLELRDGSVKDLDFPEYLDACGVSARDFHAICLRTVSSIPNPLAMSPSDFKKALLDSILFRGKLLLSGASLRCPARNSWGRDQATFDEPQLNFSTIHGVKGQQSPAVTLVLPKERLAESGARQWFENREGEERRVLYVGASRAEQLLLIAVHKSMYAGVSNKLRADDVPLFEFSPESDK